MDREQFLESLEKYHLERGHPYVPGRLLGQKVDLYEMFMTAMKQGGFPRINKNNKWGYLAKHLRLVPKDKPPSAQDLEQVKRYYVKWIRHFEGERVPQHIKKDLIPPGMELPCKRSSSSSAQTGVSSGARPAGGALGAGPAGLSPNASLLFDPQNPLAAFSSTPPNFFPTLGFGPNGVLAASPYFGLASGGPAAASGTDSPLVGLQQGLPGAAFLASAHDEQLLGLGGAGPRTRNERRLAQQFGAASGSAGAAGLGPGGGVLEMNRKRSKLFLKYSPEAVAERRWKRRRREALMARGILPPAVDVFRLQQCLEERRFAPADFIFALNILYRLSSPDRGISIQQHPGLVDQLSGILTEAALSARRSLLRRLQPSVSPDWPAFFLSIFDAELPPASRVALLHDPLRPADLLPPLPFSSSGASAAPVSEDEASLHIVSLVAATLSNILFEAGNVNFLAGVSRQCLLDASVAAGLQVAREGDRDKVSEPASGSASSFWEEVFAAARGASLLRTGGPIVHAASGGRFSGVSGGSKSLSTAVASPTAGCLGAAVGETTVADGLLVAEGGGNRHAEEERRLAVLREDERRTRNEVNAEFADEEEECSETEAVELEEEILLGLSEKSDIAFTRQCRMFRRPPSSSGSSEASSLTGGLLLGAFSSPGSAGAGVSSSGALGSNGFLSLSSGGGLGASGDGAGPSGGRTREQERLAARVRERTLKGLASALLSALDCCAIAAYEGERRISTVCTESAMRMLDAFLVRERKQRQTQLSKAVDAASPVVSGELGAGKRAGDGEKEVEAAVAEKGEEVEVSAEKKVGEESAMKEVSWSPRHRSQGSDAPCLLLSNAKKAVGALADALAAVGDEEAREEGKELREQQVCRLLVAAAHGDVAQLLQLLIQEQASGVAREESNAASFLAECKHQETRELEAPAFGLLAGYGAARKAVAIAASGREAGLMRAEAEERRRAEGPMETDEAGDQADGGRARESAREEKRRDPSASESEISAYSCSLASPDPRAGVTVGVSSAGPLATDVEMMETEAPQRQRSFERTLNTRLEGESLLPTLSTCPAKEVNRPSGATTSVVASVNGGRLVASSASLKGRAVEEAVSSAEVSETQNLLFGPLVSLVAENSSPLFSASILRPSGKSEKDGDKKGLCFSQSACGCQTPPVSRLPGEPRPEGRMREEEMARREEAEGEETPSEPDGVLALAATPLLLGHLEADQSEFAFDFAAFLSPGVSREEAASRLEALARADGRAASLVSQNPLVKQFVSDLGLFKSQATVRPTKKKKASPLEKASALSLDGFLSSEVCRALQAVQRVSEATPASRLKQLAFYRHTARILESLLSFSASSLGQAPASWEQPHGLAAFLLALQLLMLGDPQTLGKALEPVYSRVVAAAALLLPGVGTRQLSPPHTGAEGLRGPEAEKKLDGDAERRDGETKPDVEGERHRVEKHESERREGEKEVGECGEEEASNEKIAREKRAQVEGEETGAIGSENKSASKGKRDDAKAKDGSAEISRREEDTADGELANAERIRLAGWAKLKEHSTQLSPHLETGIACVKAFTALVALLPPPPSPSLFASSSSLLYRDAPQSSWLALSFVSAVARFLKSLQEISKTRIPRVLQCAPGLHFLQAVAEFASQMLLFRQTAIYAHLEIFLAVASAVLELEISVPSIQLPRILIKACLAVIYLTADGPAEALCEVLECVGKPCGRETQETSTRQRQGRKRPSPAAVEAAAKLFIAPLLRFLQFRMHRTVRLQCQSQLADPLAPSTALFEAEANRRLVSPLCPSPFATVIPHFFVSACPKGSVSLEKSRGGWAYSHYIGAIDEIPDAAWQATKAPPSKPGEPSGEPKATAQASPAALSALTSRPDDADPAPQGPFFTAPRVPLGEESAAPGLLPLSEGEEREGWKRRAGTEDDDCETEAYRRSAQVIAECAFPFVVPDAARARDEEKETPKTRALRTEAVGRKTEDKPTGKKGSGEGIGAVAIFLGQGKLDSDASSGKMPRPREVGGGPPSRTRQGPGTCEAEPAERAGATVLGKDPLPALSSLLPGEKEREEEPSPTSSSHSALEKKRDDGSDVEGREDDREETSGPSPLFGQDETHGAPQPSNRDDEDRGASANAFYANASGYYPSGPPSQGDPAGGASYPFYYASSEPHGPSAPGMWQTAPIGGSPQGPGMYPGSSFGPQGFAAQAQVANRVNPQGQWMGMHPSSQHYASSYFPENYYSSSSSWRQQQWLQWQHEQQRAVARQVCGAGSAGPGGGDSPFFPSAYPHMVQGQPPVQNWGGNAYQGGWQPGQGESRDIPFFDVNSAGAPALGAPGSQQGAGGVAAGARVGNEGEEPQNAWPTPHMQGSQEAGAVGRSEDPPEATRGPPAHRTSHPGVAPFEARPRDGECPTYPREMGGPHGPDARPSHPSLAQMSPGYTPASGQAPVASFLPSAPFGASQDRAQMYGGAGAPGQEAPRPEAYGSGDPGTLGGASQGDGAHAALRDDASCAHGLLRESGEKEETRNEREEREGKGGCRSGSPTSPGADGAGASKAPPRPAAVHAASPTGTKKKMKKEDLKAGVTDSLSAAAVAAAVAFGDEEAKVDEDVSVGVSALLLLASNSLTLPLLRPHLPTITELAWYKTTASSCLFSVVQELLSCFRDAPPVHLRGFHDGAAYFPSCVKEATGTPDAANEAARKARISEEFAKLGNSQHLLCVRKVGQAGKLLSVPEIIEMRG
ncbi:ARID/BRIGHT DNA binding domain-containing protein [Toxoplasma gondii RUB]|uniref:ARID/BRIGHT DNA binding domain-containing protein n=1 Tax=Toxoplasma gondii RUB TaxID=935652 RepID=A0A086M6T3_TOXGO|nr:ARID/BRIGHT DNA binding domain-containing protein [Toxoplasma gondii RUB]